MNFNQFLKYKNDFEKITNQYFKNQKKLPISHQSSHIFDIHFWKTEVRAWFAATSLHILLSTNAIEQFTEAISNGFTAVSFLIALNAKIAGVGLPITIYMISNMVAWRHLDQGKGVTSRYLFMVIPTGYWAET